MKIKNVLMDIGPKIDSIKPMASSLYGKEGKWLHPF
jgi:hypothetical protein